MTSARSIINLAANRRSLLCILHRCASISKFSLSPEVKAKIDEISCDIDVEMIANWGDAQPKESLVRRRMRKMYLYFTFSVGYRCTWIFILFVPRICHQVWKIEDRKLGNSLELNGLKLKLSMRKEWFCW